MKSEKERIVEANKTYCEGHAEEGIEICSWESMPGWNSFLKGEITESELSEKAKEEIPQLAQTFGKYLHNDTEKKSSDTNDDPVRRGKIKTANKIYKQACVDSGKSPCFFKNFTTWQDFVHGQINEGEFYERAMEEVRKLAAEGREIQQN